MHGEPQSIETLSNKEALLLAKYLRGENGTLIPRVPFLFPTLLECEGKEEKNSEKIAHQLLIRAIREHLFGHAKLVTVILKKRANKCKGIKDTVQLGFKIFRKFPFRYFGWSVQPAQVKEEIIGLLKILVARRPNIILEIGTANGGTLFLFSRISSPDGVLVSVDLPSGRFGGGYPEWRIPLYKSFATQKQQISLIRQDSHTLSTLNAVRTILGERRVDFLFIDGDHTYDGVKMDFEMYSKLVRKGGIIAFHDICLHPPETGCEVNKFWGEIRTQYAHDEIIKDSKQSWAGIGVIYM